MHRFAFVVPGRWASEGKVAIAVAVTSAPAASTALDLRPLNPSMHTYEKSATPGATGATVPPTLS